MGTKPVLKTSLHLFDQIHSKNSINLMYFFFLNILRAREPMVWGVLELIRFLFKM